MAGQMGWLHVGYSPVWVFLSRARSGYEVLLLAELGYRTCRCIIHIDCISIQSLYMYV